jgi:hypothetical protein
MMTCKRFTSYQDGFGMIPRNDATDVWTGSAWITGERRAASLALATGITAALPLMDALATEAYADYTIEHFDDSDAVCANIDRNHRNAVALASLPSNPAS